MIIFKKDLHLCCCCTKTLQWQATQLCFLAEVWTGLSQSVIILGERGVGNLVSRWFVMCRLEYFLGPIPLAFGLGNGSWLSFVLKHWMTVQNTQASWSGWMWCCRMPYLVNPWEFSTDLGNESDTWSNVIGKNDLPDVKTSGVLFFDGWFIMTIKVFISAHGTRTPYTTQWW